MRSKLCGVNRQEAWPAARAKLKGPHKTPTLVPAIWSQVLLGEGAPATSRGHHISSTAQAAHQQETQHTQHSPGCSLAHLPQAAREGT